MSHGQFVWYEIVTNDVAGAEAFYRDVVGWEVKDASLPGHPYAILSMGPAMIGGLMPIPPSGAAMGARPTWIGCIAVDDVDAYTRRITAARGTVHQPPADIPGVGRFAVVADPHGAAFVLSKSTGGEPLPELRPRAMGRIAWHELRAGDVDAAFAFYADLFGWTKADAMDMGPMGIYQVFALQGVAIGGMMTRTPDTSAHWTYYFNVPAIDAAAARVSARGGRVIAGPMEVPGGEWIIIGDAPQGARFGLLATAKR